MGNIRSFKDLRVWQNAMEIAIKIFEITKSFPREERFSLTDQIRRCSAAPALASLTSRSVAANITEGWRKRRYPAAFISKLNDAESEAAETQTWIEIALRCGYLTKEEASYLDRQCEEVLGQLVAMIAHPEQWTIKPNSSVQRS
ncbi:MAG: four helix bundle protein [Coleofasciculus sp. S288]|nr:four helix bundle protein [Coleofasciculus sp. S288]